MRYLIIGDLHGVFYKLVQLEHLFATVDTVIFCGDYVDRGPQPMEVLKYVAQVPNSIRLAGNHEFKYLKKIRKGNKSHPAEVKEEQFDEFVTLLTAAVGDKPNFWFKDDNIAVSHAPAALYQHNWYAVPMDKFLYGWTIPNSKDENGYPKRIPLEDKYPGEVSEKPVIFGHVHSHEINKGPQLYCVDLCCGQPDGRLGATIFENSQLVDTIII